MVCPKTALRILRGHIPGFTELFHLLDNGQGPHEHMLEPTDPVRCLPHQDDPFFWYRRRGAVECQHGGPGSTMNFWTQSSYIDRLTVGVKMRSTAAFLSVANRQGVITGGTTTRGFNDGSVRGCSLWLALSTRQVSDVVQFDENILRPKGGRHVKDDCSPASSPRSNGKQCDKYVLLDTQTDTQTLLVR